MANAKARHDPHHRFLDIVVVTMALAIAVIPMIVIAILVLLSLGRPIVFRQQRSGRDSVAFTLVKFRTMSDARHPDEVPLSDVERTPRVGRLLRRTRLDELPELWNILRGDMSLIGPRPLLPEAIDKMGPAGRQRGAVRPGLTGFAQTGGDSILSNADKLSLDLWYVENRSAELDLLVLIRTVAMMIGGDRINYRRLNLVNPAGNDEPVNGETEC